MTEPASILDCFTRTVRAAADRVALRAGGTVLTYAELHEAALLAAGALAGAHAGPPARIGVLGGRDATSYIGMLAALYVGAAVVPLNRTFPAERTQAMITAAGLTTVVTDDLGSRLLSKLDGAVPGLRYLILGDDVLGDDTAVVAPDRVRPGDTAPHRSRHGTPDDIAYIMFTSGSTGRPKGVPITHGNVLHFLRAMRRRYRLSATDVVTQTFEPTFDLFMVGPLMAWSVGAELLSVPATILHRLPDFATRHRVSMWFSVPNTISLLRRLGKLAPGALPSVRYSLFCGDALTHADSAAWQAAAPGGPVDNLYGPTELTIACTSHRWRPDGPAVGGLVPIGRPYDGLPYLLVDEDLRPVTDEGELCVTGPQMFRGYLDARDDESRFVHADGARWYRTGDRVRHLDDGALAYLGRLDHQVKIRGYRVELYEIEDEIGRLDGVRDCAVVTVRADGEATLAAFYVGDPVVAAVVSQRLSARLPEYMVPRHTWQLGKLPINSNGKVDRRRLAEWARVWSAGDGGPVDVAAAP